MIKLLVLDVDGCLTEGKIIYSSDLAESKNFNVKDGFGIVNWLKLGLEATIITGRDSKIVEYRAKELGIKYLYQGVKDKLATLEELCKNLNIDIKEVAAIGDDLNDYKMLRAVGRSFTPNDGVKEIQDIVNVVLSKKGGDAVVREMIDILIEENNLKDAFLAQWL